LVQFSAYSFTKNKYIDILKLSELILAKIIEKEEILCRFVFKRGDEIVCIRYNADSHIPLTLGILTPRFDRSVLPKYCCHGTQNDTDKIIYTINANHEYIFSNIQDTSSPDAPIYKILQAAGLIELSPELTPAVT
jgi:hypothetical protein